MLQPQEFSWPLLPRPSDGEPQVLGEPSLTACIHKTILPPPAFALERFPPRVVIMKCHRGNSWNIICSCLLSPTLPPLPPTSSLSEVMFAVQEKPSLFPSSPSKPAKGTVCTSQSHPPPKYPYPLTAPWYLPARQNLPNSTGCSCSYQDFLPSSVK